MKYLYLVILVIFLTVFGCSTRDVSSPSSALIGHWQNIPGKVDFYFSSDGIFTDPTGLDLSVPFTVEEENLGKKTISIKMLEKSFKLPDGYELNSMQLDLIFSSDFTSFSGTAYESKGFSWDPNIKEKTEMFKLHFKYIDAKEKPSEN